MSARLEALRQLRDCGVVRTRFHHQGFADLLDLGIADPAIVPDDDNGLDWRLTDKGRHVAAVAFKEGNGS